MQGAVCMFVCAALATCLSAVDAKVKGRGNERSARSASGSFETTPAVWTSIMEDACLRRTSQGEDLELLSCDFGIDLFTGLEALSGAVEALQFQLNALSNQLFLLAYPVTSCPIAVSTPTQYSYMPIWDVDGESEIPSAVGETLFFSARGCNDAHVFLTEEPLSDNGPNVYEIVLGGFSNSRSLLRTSMQQNPPEDDFNHTPLDCDEFRNFYISWEGDTVDVGTVTADFVKNEPFMSYTNPTPFAVNYAYVSGWTTAAVDYRIASPCEEEGDPVPPPPIAKRRARQST